jgi:hypothetical protein
MWLFSVSDELTSSVADAESSRGTSADLENRIAGLLDEIEYITNPQLDYDDSKSSALLERARFTDLSAHEHHIAALDYLALRLSESGLGSFPADTFLALRHVAGDGNCLLHALADVLRTALEDPVARTALDHIALRRAIRAYYVDHREEYQGFWSSSVDPDASDAAPDAVASFDEFLDQIVTDGEPGAQPVHTAVEQLFGVNVFTLRFERVGQASRTGKSVRKNELPVYREVFADDHPERRGRPAVMLLYEPGGACGGHYYAVVPSALELSAESVALLHSAAMYSFPSNADAASAASAIVVASPSAPVSTSASPAVVGSPGGSTRMPVRTAEEVVHLDVPGTLAGGWYRSRVLDAASDSALLAILTSECGLGAMSMLLCVGLPSTALRAAMLRTPPRITMCVALDPKHHAVRSFACYQASVAHAHSCCLTLGQLPVRRTLPSCASCHQHHRDYPLRADQCRRSECASAVLPGKQSNFFCFLIMLTTCHCVL